MKFLNILIIIFISLTSSIKADFNENFKNNNKENGKLILIRHAYAPGNGDPENFKINDCTSQRNLNQSGREQAKKIGITLKKLKINLNNIYSSEWCRCQDTAKIAFNKYENLNYLNSFYSSKYSKNKKKQIIELKNFIKNWDQNKDLVLITHYVVILELLGLATNSGDIVFFDKDFNVLNLINTLS